MDFIIMLIIFGVISSLGKKNKKPQQNQRRTLQDMPQRNIATEQQQARREALQGKTSSAGRQETIQGGLTSLFNMLAGEEVIKDLKTLQRQRSQPSAQTQVREESLRRQAEEEELYREKRDREYEEQSLREREIWNRENEDIDEIGDLPEIIDEISEGEGLDLRRTTSDSPRDQSNDQTGISEAYSLSELQKGIIWREILEKPKALRNTHQN